MRRQILSSVAMRYASCLQTWERRAYEAISMIAVCWRISIRISDGMDAIGQGGGGNRSRTGRTPCIVDVDNEAMSWDKLDFGGPSREWWAGFGTVTAALDGLGLAISEVNDDGGKCLFLYILSTPASS